MRKASPSKAKRKKPGPTIIRAPHDRQNPYVQIRRSSLEDEALSWEARGLLAYLLAKPDDWEIQVGDLVNSGSAGRDKVYRMMGELEAQGYLKRVRTRADDHTFTGIRYHLYESPHPDSPDTENQEMEPLPENPDTAEPDTDFPDTEIQALENRTHTNKEDTNKENNTKEEGTKESSAASGDKPPTLTPQQRIFGKVCEIIGWDYRAIDERSKLMVAQTTKILIEAEYTLEDLSRFWPEIWVHDWRWTEKHSYPTLKQLRQEIGKLRAVHDAAPDSPSCRQESAASQSVNRVVAMLTERQAHEHH